MFEVNYDPAAGTATWTRLDGTGGGALGDLPVTDLVRDHQTGDLYASTDFGVLYDNADDGINWLDAAGGMPNVMVAGLTIDVDRRLLWAASHGQGAWRLDLR